MHWVSSKRWGMPAIGDNHTVRTLPDVIEANVHYTDSAAPHGHTLCDDTLRAIDSDHRDRGWACIGYSRVICSHGYVYQGRPLRVVPAAAEGHNAHIAAYCFITNGDVTDAAWIAFLAILRSDEERLHRHLSLTTHREVEPPGYTECPGDHLEARVRHLRKAHT